MPLRKKHRKTLEALFATPTPADVRWADVVGLIGALGGYVDEGRSGSRAAIEIRGRVASVHAPHPQPEMKRYAVRQLRDFLADVGITPGDV